MQSNEFAGKRIAIIGIARTGLATAPVLRDLGAEIILSDAAGCDKLGEDADRAAQLGVEVRLNAGPEEALERVEMVVPSPGVRRDAPVLRLAQERGLSILSEIEVAYRVSRAPILAVTGTNGKTTTALWLGAMLRETGRKTWVAGNVAADEIKQALITAAMQADAEDVIVAEVSSFQLEWVEKFRPRVGILTNITADHLDRHGSMEEYIRCKARLFAAQRPEDVAVINVIHRSSCEIGRRLPARVVWFPCENGPHDNVAFLREGRLVVRWEGREYALCLADTLQLPGAHNVENALAAAAAAIAFGAKAEAVERALRGFAGVPHRMEVVRELSGILYINNSMCTNVAAAVRSLEAVGRPAVVIAGGVDKDSDFTPLGAAFARYARHVVLIGKAASKIEEAARTAGFKAVSQANSMEEAVAQASRIARPGEAVLLSPACASFDMFRDFEARGEAFRQAVRALTE